VNITNKHLNLDNLFLKMTGFNLRDKIALIGMTDLSILPSLSEKLHENNRLALISINRRYYTEMNNYINEFELDERIISLYFDLDKISSWKDSQFDQIICLNIDILKRDPIAILSIFLRLLKDTKHLTIYLENTEKNEFFLRKLLYEASVGEIIGLLEKVGFSNKFYIKRFIDKELKAISIRSTKPKAVSYLSHDLFN